jgi:uncharacterized protein (TIGR00725 family)
VYIDTETDKFYTEEGLFFDLNSMQWMNDTSLPTNKIKITYQDAVKKIQKSKNKIKIPVGVIGTNSPNEEQYAIAQELGDAISFLGLSIICGGRAGVMEAVCRGVAKNDGISIGILPEGNTDNVNKFVTIPLATGVGFARNAIIASSALCLVAIGGGNGTLSEIAYGLQFGKRVLSINCDLIVNKMEYCFSIEEIIEKICKVILKLE